MVSWRAAVPRPFVPLAFCEPVERLVRGRYVVGSRIAIRIAAPACRDIRLRINERAPRRLLRGRHVGLHLDRVGVEARIRQDGLPQLLQLFDRQKPDLGDGLQGLQIALHGARLGFQAGNRALFGTGHLARLKISRLQGREHARIGIGGPLLIFGGSGRAGRRR